jgi:hypothetical protein
VAVETGFACGYEAVFGHGPAQQVTHILARHSDAVVFTDQKVCVHFFLP